MASSQTSATSTNVTQANIDSFGVITLDASAPNVSYTLGAPSLGAGAGVESSTSLQRTARKILYSAQMLVLVQEPNKTYQ